MTEAPGEDDAKAERLLEERLMADLERRGPWWAQGQVIERVACLPEYGPSL